MKNVTITDRYFFQVLLLILRVYLYKKVNIASISIGAILIFLLAVTAFVYGGNNQIQTVFFEEASRDIQVLKDRSYTINGAPFKMVFVEGGMAKLGHTPHPLYQQSTFERDAFDTTVASFWLGETEVTQELWLAVMGDNPSSVSLGLQHPVETITWLDAQVFTQKISEMTGQTFYIPSEVEWEYAGRGGNKSKDYLFAGVSDVKQLHLFANFCQAPYCAVWGAEKNEDIYNDGYKWTSPVKSFKPNELGLYDMTGNVAEWCSDEYNGEFATLENQEKIIMGGAWNDWYPRCLLSRRRPMPSGLRLEYYGLRIACK